MKILFQESILCGRLGLPSALISFLPRCSSFCQASGSKGEALQCQRPSRGSPPYHSKAAIDRCCPQDVAGLSTCKCDLSCFKKCSSFKKKSCKSWHPKAQIPTWDVQQWLVKKNVQTSRKSMEIGISQSRSPTKP